LYVLAGGVLEVLTATVKADVKKRRSPEQKYGKYKWLRILVRRNAEEIRDIKRILTGMTFGLRHLMEFDSEYLLDMACVDGRDQAILDLLREVGPSGLSPKEIHSRLGRYGLKYHHITRRITRMNKRMQNKIGQRAAEKVGRNWALSDFLVRNWNVKKTEVESENSVEW
jgi:hypothetical protein